MTEKRARDKSKLFVLTLETVATVKLDHDKLRQASPQE